MGGRCGVKRCAREPLASAPSDLDKIKTRWVNTPISGAILSLSRVGSPVNSFMLTLREKSPRHVECR